VTPGQYLRNRREAARLGTIQAAAHLALLASLPRARNQRAAIASRLNAAEADELTLGAGELALIRDWAFPLDPAVYLQLADLHADPGNPDLPRPAVCRECGCSWTDPCLMVAPFGSCCWAEQPTRERGGLCSRCLRVKAATIAPVLVSNIEVTLA
jgi:hypothetical protein